MSTSRAASLFLLIAIVSSAATTVAQGEKDLGLQLAENPPMQTISREPPAPPTATELFEVPEGFTLIETLHEFRVAIKEDGQKLRLKPGVYRASTTDPPVEGLQHIFAVTGSGNHFDLRGVVFETPVSVQSTLSLKAHVSSSWHIFGNNNTFRGGYFRNVIDKRYPEYSVTECEFEVLGDGNTFRDCTFVIRGSIPYGYTDFYGKGGPNFGRLNKHSCLLIRGAKNTRLLGCQAYMQSFGHCLFFDHADGVRVDKCLFGGTLRPTNDIYKEKVGRASEYDFKAMYRGERPIPRDDMIPLTEDGVRSYSEVKNLHITNTTVERLRGGFQLICVGDVTLENVTVLEAGDFGFDISSGSQGTILMKDCRSDVAYSPVFNFSRGDVPVGSHYEVTILSPDETVLATPRTSLGTICGDRCTFILHDGTTRPLPESVNYLRCGGFRNGALTDSKVTNHTTAKLILSERVRDCVIESVGPVEDNGRGNTVVQLPPHADSRR